jgi:hypothetical protein
MSLSFPRLPAVTARTRRSSPPPAFGWDTGSIIDITIDVADGLSMNVALEHPLGGPAHGRLNVGVEPRADDTDDTDDTDETEDSDTDDSGNADAA